MITNEQRDELWRELGREPTEEQLTLRFEPHRYGSLARLVDISMRQTSKPCRGGHCDEFDRCKRHERFDARRYVALVDRWRKLGWPHWGLTRTTTQELAVRGYTHREPPNRYGRNAGKREILRGGRVVGCMTVFQCNEWIRRLDRKMRALTRGRR